MKVGSAFFASLLMVGCVGGANPVGLSSGLHDVSAASDMSVASIDPRIRYKDGERYLRDLSDGLVIPRDEICRELGRYDCFAEAFRIVLGGVEGPNLLVNEPLEIEALTAPIAYDRVALNVCATRVQRDIADPGGAVLFARHSGRKPSRAWLNTTANEIYSRILRRDATDDERASLVGFYREIGADSASSDPAKDWTILGCFAVATSLEAIFY